MEPLITGGIIAGAASLASAGGSAMASAKLNKRTIKYNKEMYGISRADRLADWHMQNQYNSPEAQMQRLKDAGLNPHLVYGSGADAKVGDVTQPNALGANLKAEDYLGSMSGALGDSITSYLGLKQQQANIAKTNAETQNIQGKTYEQEFMNQILDKDWAQAIRTAKAMSIGEMQQNILGKSVDTQLKREMMGDSDSQVSVIRDISSEVVGSVFHISTGERGRNLHVEKTTREIERIGKEIQSIASGTALKDQQHRINELEIQFTRELGIPANSPYWFSFIVRILKSQFGLSLMNLTPQ